jgi:hypothetical protein
VIIICRFLLDIRQRNEHPNSSPSLQIPITSFHAATQRFDNMVMQEFGDIAPSESLNEDQTVEMELQEQHQNTTPAVDISEYPWANGEIGDEEAGSMPA